MQVKFPKDALALSDLKTNPEKVIGRMQDTHNPIVLTCRGRGVAVLQGIEGYEKAAEELRFAKSVVKGLVDVCEGNIVSLESARKRLGIK